MGAAGSGKTSVSRVGPVMITRNSPNCLQFIDLASGLSLEARSNSTAEVQPTGFTLDDREVTLIDVPGFGDTSTSEDNMGILQMIADFLATE